MTPSKFLVLAAAAMALATPAVSLGSAIAADGAAPLAAQAGNRATSTATTTKVAAATSAADTCAKGLPAESRMIYDATIKTMKGLDTLRDTVIEQTRAMVMAGKLTEANARPAAEAAGTCLRLLAKS